jgi:hypothetical protein
MIDIRRLLIFYASIIRIKKNSRFDQIINRKMTKLLMKPALIFLFLCSLLPWSASGAGKPKRIDVFLIAGQSNATGQGYIANLPKGFVPNGKVLLFHSGRPHLNSGAEPYTWMPLRQASESPDRFGPELGFGNQMQALNPKSPIALIKHAHSGTNLYSDWNPGDSVKDTVNWGVQYAVFVSTVESALKGLRKMGYDPVIKGMIWQQGESDADKGGSVSEDYGKNLAHFIKRVREQFSCPEMIFVYGYIYPPPNVGKGNDLVRKGQYEVDQNSGSPLSVKGAFVVPTEDLDHRANDYHSPLPNDYVHFGSAGTLELGRRMAVKMCSELKNTFTVNKSK